MKSNKLVLSFFIVLVFSILLAGCGGGGGGSTATTTTSTTPGTTSTTSNPAAIYITMQNTSGAALAGAVVHYTDPSGAAKTTAASDSNGKITIVISPVGNYTIGTFVYNGVTYSGMNITLSYNTSYDYYQVYQLHTTVGSGITLTDSHSVAR